MYIRGRIPYQIAWHEVFDQYYKMKVYDKTTGRGDAQSRDFLIDLVAMMRKHRTDRLLRSYVRTNQKLREQIDNPTKTSAYTKLKNENILYEIPPKQEIKFAYDRFYEYLLAQSIRIEPFDTEHCLDLIKESEKFRSLRGAIAIALIIEKRYDIIHNLSTEDTYTVRSILIDALATLAIQDPDATISFLRDLLKSEYDAAKRLAVLTILEIRPIPVILLEEALKDENPSIRKLAVQCAYLLWVRNRELGENVAKQIASIGLRDMLKPTLETSLELQERIFFNHFKDPDAIRLVDSLGMERLRTSKLRSVVMNKVIIYIATEITERMYTSFWGWSYKDWVAPVFSASEKYRKAVKNIFPYLDSNQKLNEESKKNLYDVAAGAMAGIASLVLIFQVKENTDNTIPLIREFINSKDDRIVQVGMKGLAFGSRFHDLTQELELAKEMIYQNPSYRHVLIDIGLNLSARRSGEIKFITSIMKRAKDEGNLKALINSVLALGDIGIRYPENSLLSLEVAFDNPHEEIVNALLLALGRLRVFYPDKVDNYLWKRHREFLGKIPPLEVREIPIEMWNAIEFAQFLFYKMPRMRDIFIEMLERWADMKNRNEFRKLLRFCIQRSVETWIERKNVEEYLRYAEEDVIT